MSLTKFIRDLQRRYNVGIPGPAAIFYNLIAIKILRKPERKIVDEVIKKIGSGTLLDLGSGTGFLAIEIARKNPSLYVYGIDLSRQMIRIARAHAKGIENVQFKLGDAAKLLFENDSIDFIVSTLSLHHWTRPAQVFNECHRVLKIGKEAWIYDGCPDLPKEESDRIKKEYGFLGYLFSTQITKLYGFTLKEYQHEIKDILEQSKFKDSYQMELRDAWMKITLKK